VVAPLIGLAALQLVGDQTAQDVGAALARAQELINRCVVPISTLTPISSDNSLAISRSFSLR
jgi:hypothetical protein